MDEHIFYQSLMERFRKLVDNHRLQQTNVTITGAALTPKEAIGTPRRQDFPIIKGKEQLMQADFKGSKGQAFTDMPGNFSGELHDVIGHYPVNNNERAIMIAAVNAVCRNLGCIDNSIHCKNEEPEQCARHLVDYIKENFGQPRVALIGMQPAMLENLADSFPVRIVDLDPERIGQIHYDVLIEDPQATDEVLQWCDLALITGSTVVNGSIINFLDLDKTVIFYGTSIAGPAYLMGLQRFCPLAQ